MHALMGCKSDLRSPDIQHKKTTNESAYQEQIHSMVDTIAESASDDNKLGKSCEQNKIIDIDTSIHANITAEFDALKEKDHTVAEFDSLAETNDYQAEFDTMAEQGHYEAEFDSLNEKDYVEAEFDKINQDNVKAEFDSIEHTQAEPEPMDESR